MLVLIPVFFCSFYSSLSNPFSCSTIYWLFRYFVLCVLFSPDCSVRFHRLDFKEGISRHAVIHSSVLLMGTWELCWDYHIRLAHIHKKIIKQEIGYISADLPWHIAPRPEPGPLQCQKVSAAMVGGRWVWKTSYRGFLLLKTHWNRLK